MPQFMPICVRIGPLTMLIEDAELEVDERADSSADAIARITGRYSGRAPAITALTATCSTVIDHWPRLAVGCRRPTILSAAWLVPLSIAATRSSVGSTIGRLSVQWLS